MRVARNVLDTQGISAPDNLTRRLWLEKAIFREKGEYWTVGYGEGALVRLTAVNSEPPTDRLQFERLTN